MITISDADAATYREALVSLVDDYVDIIDSEWNADFSNEARVVTLRKLVEVLKGDK